MTQDKILGGLYGALIGDAVGVSYEFTYPYKMPPLADIDIIPKPDWRKTYASIKPGTYSDDGAQILCLLEVLLNKSENLVEDLHASLKSWWKEGYMAVDGITFDIGNQTRDSLSVSPERVIEAFSKEIFSGNGSLMRTLPAALVTNNRLSAIDIAVEQSKATHPNDRCQVCCGIYAGAAFGLLHGEELNAAIENSMVVIASRYRELEPELRRVYEARFDEPQGSGYVVNALWSSVYAFNRGTTYEEVIREAVGLGNDTDTTGCIAGGWAGIKYGHAGIPLWWLENLRGQEIIRPLANRLVEFLNDEEI